MKNIKELELGFADAANYRKRENKDLFNKIFVKGEYLDRLCEPDISFLIGEKGTGKTAYAVYLTNNNYKNTKIVKNSFLYPSFPRIFKNFEVICKAVEILENKNIENFKVYLTIDGNENIYSKEIVEKYGRLKCIEFIGLQTRENLMKYYSKIETVIFPSKLETWGLPISEAKAFGKNIILADLEYAHETLGTYEKVMFFGPDDAEKLAEKMEMLINDDENMKNIEFDGNIEKNIEKPFCKNWKELFDILLLDNR